MSDLSVAGACLLTREGLLAGDRVTLSFVAPTLWDPLVLQARVAWAMPISRMPTEASRAGVAFEARDPSGLFALFELMGSLAYDD